MKSHAHIYCSYMYICKQKQTKEMEIKIKIITYQLLPIDYIYWYII